MRISAILVCAGMALGAVPLRAADVSAALIERMRAADVVLLGEVHDNPSHHALQAKAIEALHPTAVVWEMMTPETAARIDAGWLNGEGHLDQALKWAEAGWPHFDLYRPVLEASRGLPVYGALVPRKAARAVMTQGIAVVFGSAAADYGLMVPLPRAEQARREAAQAEAHCNALPPDQLPMMVDFQRLRDAMLARAAVRAAEETVGPVVVITGNGHARADHGVPDVLRRVRPGLRVFALGQSEDGAIEGRFDAVLDSPAVDRPDPCAAFRKKE